MAHDQQLPVENESEQSVVSKPSRTLSDTVADWLTLYAQTYREEITEELALLYQKALSDIRPEILHKAFLRAARTCKFRPTPAEVRLAAEAEFEKAGIKREIECEKCRSTGWKLVGRPDGLGTMAVLCECRKAA